MFHPSAVTEALQEVTRLFCNRHGALIAHVCRDDRESYHRIIVALNETIPARPAGGRLMSEIDKVIDAHGGWPLRSSCNTIMKLKNQ